MEQRSTPGVLHPWNIYTELPKSRVEDIGLWLDERGRTLDATSRHLQQRGKTQKRTEGTDEVSCGHAHHVSPSSERRRPRNIHVFQKESEHWLRQMRGCHANQRHWVICGWKPRVREFRLLQLPTEFETGRHEYFQFHNARRYVTVLLGCSSEEHLEPSLLLRCIVSHSTGAWNPCHACLHDRFAGMSVVVTPRPSKRQIVRRSCLCPLRVCSRRLPLATKSCI